MVKLYKSLEDICLDLNIDLPISDIDAYQNDTYNFVYNKLWLAQKQKLESGPKGLYPKKYPVITKPIINLFGMSRGFKICYNKEDLDKFCKDGFFWEKYLDGDNFTIDMILLNGKIKQIFVFQSYPNNDGTFKYHKYLSNFKLKNKNVIEQMLCNYTGPINVEIIDNYIIEMHLRMNGDFFLYNADFVKNLYNLITTKKYKHMKFGDCYMIPVFVETPLKMSSKQIAQIKLICKDCDKIMFDNTFSEYQKDNMKRLLMFSCKDLDYGVLVKKRIYDYILKNINQIIS
jgi:hypothetical protein